MSYCECNSNSVLWHFWHELGRNICWSIFPSLSLSLSLLHKPENMATSFRLFLRYILKNYCYILYKLLIKYSLDDFIHKLLSHMLTVNTNGYLILYIYLYCTIDTTSKCIFNYIQSSIYNIYGNSIDYLIICWNLLTVVYILQCKSIN